MPQMLANDLLPTLQGEVRTGVEVREKPSSPPPLIGGECGGEGGAPQGEGEERQAGIAPAVTWGAFAGDFDPAERRVRLYAPRQTARLLSGIRAADLCRLLAQAETDPNALEPACQAHNAMAANDRSQIWAAYAGLARTASNRGDR